jgi:hypothetical protein
MAVSPAWAHKAHNPWSSSGGAENGLGNGHGPSYRAHPRLYPSVSAVSSRLRLLSNEHRTQRGGSYRRMLHRVLNFELLAFSRQRVQAVHSPACAGDNRLKRVRLSKFSVEKVERFAMALRLASACASRHKVQENLRFSLGSRGGWLTYTNSMLDQRRPT